VAIYSSCHPGQPVLRRDPGSRIYFIFYWIFEYFYAVRRIPFSDTHKILLIFAHSRHLRGSESSSKGASLHQRGGRLAAAPRQSNVIRVLANDEEKLRASVRGFFI
jgi:hypothetical protein